MSKEVMQQALDALETAVGQNQCDMLMTGEECRKGEAAIAALRAALAQPVQPAPDTIHSCGYDSAIRQGGET